MKPFTTFTGIVLPLDRSNVDTDSIIPKQYLKSIHKTGFGVSLFDDWRYLDPGNPGDDHGQRRINPDFVLNQSRYHGAAILITRENFGCGSSREHAVWALMDFGIRAVLAPSYADIFFSNSLKNGLLPIVLPAETIDRLIKDTLATDGYRLTVDLEKQKVITPDGGQLSFEIDAGYKERLLKGLDEIGVTLTSTDDIRAYEKKQKGITPWLFGDRK
jgi:3-isopropylmalate/(R)-2-methylmalate dehydratase small subunit